MHHHWHLHIMLGAWSLQHVCAVLIGGLSLALLLPGLAMCHAPAAVTGAVGTAQVRGMCLTCHSAAAFSTTELLVRSLQTEVLADVACVCT